MKKNDSALEDEMYRLADLVFLQRVWRRLDSSELFAFELSDGNIGYVSVAGSPNTNKDIDFSLYVGTDALKTFFEYDNVLNNSKHNELKLTDALFGQDAIHVTFLPSEFLEQNELDKARYYSNYSAKWNEGEHLYTKFYRNYPNYYLLAGLPEEEDKKRMIEALKAIKEVGRALNSGELKEDLGFRPYENMRGSIPFLKLGEDGGYIWSKKALPRQKAKEYVKTKFEDEILQAKIRHLPRRHTTFEVELLKAPFGVIDKDFHNMEYYYPMLFLYDPQEGIIWTVMSSEREEEGYGSLLNRLGNDLINFTFAPDKIAVPNKKTYYVLEDFCKKVGIELEIVEDLPELDHEEGAFFVGVTEKGTETIDSALEAILNVVPVNSLIKALDNYYRETFEREGFDRSKFDFNAYNKDPVKYIRGLLEEEGEEYDKRHGFDGLATNSSEFISDFLASIVDPGTMMSNLVSGSSNFKNPFLIDIEADDDFNPNNSLESGEGVKDFEDKLFGALTEYLEGLIDDADYDFNDLGEEDDPFSVEWPSASPNGFGKKKKSHPIPWLSNGEEGDDGEIKDSSVIDLNEFLSGKKGRGHSDSSGFQGEYTGDPSDDEILAQGLLEFLLDSFLESSQEDGYSDGLDEDEDTEIDFTDFNWDLFPYSTGKRDDGDDWGWFINHLDDFDDDPDDE